MLWFVLWQFFAPNLHVLLRFSTKKSISWRRQWRRIKMAVRMPPKRAVISYKKGDFFLNGWLIWCCILPLCFKVCRPLLWLMFVLVLHFHFKCVCEWQHEAQEPLPHLLTENGTDWRSSERLHFHLFTKCLQLCLFVARLHNYCRCLRPWWSQLSLLCTFTSPIGFRAIM